MYRLFCILALTAATVHGCAIEQAEKVLGIQRPVVSSYSEEGEMLHEIPLDYAEILSRLPDLAPREEAETRGVCERQKLEIDCGPDKVIQILKATYGRKDQPHQRCLICPQYCNPTQNFDCESHMAHGVAAMHCNFERKCTLFATNNFFRKDPCPGTFKYMTVQYKCLEDVRKRTVACEKALLDLKCPYGRVIRILGGRYGRFKPCSEVCNARCAMPLNYPCLKGIGLDLAYQCNGLPECPMKLKNKKFRSTPEDPCPGVRKHAEVDYMCVAYSDVHGHQVGESKMKALTGKLTEKTGQ